MEMFGSRLGGLHICESIFPRVMGFILCGPAREDFNLGGSVATVRALNYKLCLHWRQADRLHVFCYEMR